MMFGYCGVTDDKIHFGVPVSKKQNMLWGLGGGLGGGGFSQTLRAGRLWAASVGSGLET